MEWRDEFWDYAEEACEPMARELRRAQRHDQEIVGTDGDEMAKKMARNVYSALRRLIKHPEARQIVRTTPDKKCVRSTAQVTF